MNAQDEGKEFNRIHIVAKRGSRLFDDERYRQYDWLFLEFFRISTLALASSRE